MRFRHSLYIVHTLMHTLRLQVSCFCSGFNVLSVYVCVKTLYVVN